MSQQRRVVTVLFADVVGSTGIGERLDPEDLRALLTRYFAIARDVIEEYGGTLEKFIGDAVMAVFGVPRAHDDDVRRALSAAVDLRDRVRSDSRLSSRVPIRIGVNTGEVASGLDETTGQELVTGDAINVAARLQQGAGEWAIVVGQRTAAAAGSEFEFGPPLEVEARGRMRFVEARELVGVRSTPASHPTSFVGRGTDLEQLELIARRVFDERRAWSVTILAPPGTGKSRLLAEFLKRLSRHTAGPVIAQAHLLPYGQRLSYWALRPLLSDLVDADTDADADSLRAAAVRWLKQAGEKDAKRVAELLSATLGAVTAAADGEGPQSEEELYAAWRTLIERAAHRAPLVIALEDLHWASDSLLDLLERAVQPRRDVPILLVAVARPELVERRQTWGVGRRNQTTIDLTPLDRESILQIVRELLPAADPATVDTIVERAEGNPFFAIEMARAVLQQPTQAVAAGVAGALPDTVQGTIQARIDLLDVFDRSVLQAGSVFGRSFSADGVAAVTSATVDDVRSSIDRLVERDLLAQSDDGDAHPRHVLIRDVAYAGLSRVDRARAHAGVASWLATGAGDAQAQAELIAFHFREAASLLSAMEDPPPDAAAVRGNAVEWLQRAADRALGAAASDDAASHLQAAIDLADRADLPALYERLGDTNLRGDLMASAYRHGFDVAREEDREPDEQLRLASKLLMQYTRNQGALASRPTPAELEALRDAGRKLIPLSTDKQAVARFLIAEAFIPFWTAGATDADAARDAARQGLAIAQNLGDAALTSAALDALTALADTWNEANDHANRRLATEKQLPLAERFDAHAVAAWTAAMVGDLHEAERVAAAGLSGVQTHQAPTFSLHVAAWRAYALRHLGRWDELDQVGDQAAELWVATGREPAGFAVRGFIDCLLAARARRLIEPATRWTKAAEDILDAFAIDHPIRRLSVFLEPAGHSAAGYLADIETTFAEMGVLVRADYVERAVGICADTGWKLPTADVVRLRDEARRLGAVLLEGQLSRALALATDDPDPLESALATFESSGAMPLVARARVELGRMKADHELVASGSAALEALGDAEQLDRFASR